MSGGPLPAWLAPLARPAALGYGCVVRRRNARFDVGRGVERLPLPVISVGNLTTGGTGKSPVVAWVVDVLRRAGGRPLIAMRGYGTKTDGRSDEELEYGHSAPGTPVVAHPARRQAVVAALTGGLDADCVVLDDGFQHRRLARDLDLVLIDATRPGLGDRLLPAGWLREPATSLARASAVLVTRSKAIDPELGESIARIHGRPPIAWSRHAWRGVSEWTEGVERRCAADSLAGRHVYGLFGTGNPEAVRSAYAGAGATVVGVAALPDHAAYSARSLRRLVAQARARGADAIATTRKDWMKLRPLVAQLGGAPAGMPFLVPDLAIEFLAGEHALAHLVRAAARSGDR